MGMQVNEAGRGDQAGGINHLFGGGFGQGAGWQSDGSDLAVLDCDNARKPGATSPVKDAGIPDQDVIAGRLGHSVSAQRHGSTDQQNSFEFAYSEAPAV